MNHVLMYLKMFLLNYTDGMEVSVQLYDDRPLSASIPNKVTCTVVEAAEAQKGSGTPP